MESNSSVPMLFPVEPEKFWQQMRLIIREEVKNLESGKSAGVNDYETPGLIQKPLYKIAEVCKIFAISRQTVYEWIRDGKLKPFKVRSRVYFLYNDIANLIARPQ